MGGNLLLGIIKDEFVNIEYQNEDDVKLKFIIPFFLKFLGYVERNIKPEIAFKKCKIE